LILRRASNQQVLLCLIFVSLVVLRFSQNATNLERFQLSISKREMYPGDDSVVDALVQDMTQLPIQHVGKFKFNKNRIENEPEMLRVLISIGNE